jgi:hypothetical protein
MKRQCRSGHVHEPRTIAVRNARRSKIGMIQSPASKSGPYTFPSLQKGRAVGRRLAKARPCTQHVPACGETSVPTQSDVSTPLLASAISHRIFMGMQPRQMLRSTLMRRPTLPGGHLGLIALLVSIVSVIYKTFKHFVVNRTRQCTDCNGYTIRQLHVMWWILPPSALSARQQECWATSQRGQSLCDRHTIG